MCNEPTFYEVQKRDSPRLKSEDFLFMSYVEYVQPNGPHKINPTNRVARGDDQHYHYGVRWFVSTGLLGAS